MYKIFLALSLSFLFLINSVNTYASESFVSVVNPVRGKDFSENYQDLVESLKGQVEILSQSNTPATFLIRYDALNDENLLSFIKDSDFEKGLFLEVTTSWTNASQIVYQKSEAWHLAGSVFLTGYSQKDRERLIDTAFEKFKKTFGFYPKSVGAWWIDAYSLDYMQKKYKIDAALIVSDQYSTDNYQIWGQYFSTPYYPAKKSVLTPAQSSNNKINLVVMQWAPRDPVNGYGNGVNESTYSVQANDYTDYHDLNSNYFSDLVDLYTTQKLNSVNQIIVGLENSYSWNKYKTEYSKQMQSLLEKQGKNQLKIITMSDFGIYYKNKFPDISPEQIIVADDPLGTDKKAVWFMNPSYRAAWFFNRDGSVFRDIREYSDGDIESCYATPCQKLDFAFLAKGVLDEVTNGQKLIIDYGKITDFRATKQLNKYTISYINQSGLSKYIEFLPRDISINDRVRTIAGIILDANTQHQNTKLTHPNILEQRILRLGEGTAQLMTNIFKFLFFLILAILIPGIILVKKLSLENKTIKLFLAISLGISQFTLIAYFANLFHLFFAIHIYLVICSLIFLKSKIYLDLKDFFGPIQRNSLILIAVILLGTIYQGVEVWRSGWVYNFGVGFWGPTGHDLVWHQALINQLAKGLPVQNPIFSGQMLTNYHYFYDLLLAMTSRISTVNTLDLIYRLYPVLFSILLGVGIYVLTQRIFQNKLVSFLSVYLTFFGSSFGWIVDYIKNRHLGGESVFWANQPVSFNLNPPFAISLIFTLTAILLFDQFRKYKNRYSFLSLLLITGPLIEFKVYAGIIVLASLFVFSLYELIFKKEKSLFLVTISATILSAIVFLPQNSGSGALLVYSPFWFIHSMVDFPDRVGWLRLSMARSAYYERGDWFKYILTEGLGLFLFITGNFGTRVIGFIALIKQPRNDTGILKQFVTVMILISILIPLIFIQKGNSWNIIQFLYYAMFLLVIFTSATIVWLYNILPKFLGVIVLLLFIIITPIGAFSTFLSGFGKIPPTSLGFGELEGLNFLKNQPEGIVLTSPFDKNQRSKFIEPVPLYTYDTTAYVSAFSNHPAYLEDYIQQEIFQNDYKKRLVESTDFLNGRDKDWSIKFLKKNNIRYIYLLKINKYSLNLGGLNLKKVFENEEVDIFKTN